MSNPNSSNNAWTTQTRGGSKKKNNAWSKTAKTTLHNGWAQPVKTPSNSSSDFEEATQALENLSVTSEYDSSRWWDLPSIPKYVKTTMENKERILANHSSEKMEGAFTRECGLCNRFYRACLFSNSERKQSKYKYYSKCRWCALDLDTDGQTEEEIRRVDFNTFSIHQHMHCTQVRTTCRQVTSLPPPVVKTPEKEEEVKTTTVYRHNVVDFEDDEDEYWN